MNENDSRWDCIVVGGGAAGLSAALVLGRARLRTLVVDAGQQSNLPATGIGGLLGHDGRAPADLYAAGRAELERYPSVEVRTATVVDGEPIDGGFRLVLTDGSAPVARRLLLATGMDYRRPDVPGVAERWGRSVFHCPFCHGWEVRGEPLGVLDRGPTAVHRVILLRTWSDDVTLYADGPAGLAADEVDHLRTAGVAIEERPVVGLQGPAPDLAAVVLDGGTERTCHGLLVAVTLHQRDGLAARLGLHGEEVGLAADALAVDPLHHASVPGVFVAGDATGAMPSVVNAMAAGSNAAAMVVRDLAGERFGVAI